MQILAIWRSDELQLHRLLAILMIKKDEEFIKIGNCNKLF
jgi:hypothetical protein